MPPKKTGRGREGDGLSRGGQGARDVEASPGDGMRGHSRGGASDDLAGANWMTPELYLKIKELEAEREREHREHEREQREHERELEAERERERREREREQREHELLVLDRQKELALLRSAPVPGSSVPGSGNGQVTPELSSEIDVFAKRVRGVIEKMPASREYLPSWFRGVQSDYELMQVPERLWGTLLMPFLSAKGRGLIAHLSPTEKANFQVLKSELLKGFRLSPEEYHRKVQAASKERSESWTQFASRLEDLFEYYLDSRNVSDFETVKKLAVADLFKEKLPPSIRQHVLLQEGSKNWLPASEIALLCQKFEEAQRAGARNNKDGMYFSRACETEPGSQGTSGQDVRGKITDTVGRGTDWKTASGRSSPNKGREYRCWNCNLPGHFGRDCPRKRSEGNEKPHDMQKKVFCVREDTEDADVTDTQEEEKLIARVSCSAWNKAPSTTSAELADSPKVNWTGGECPTVELMCGKNKMTAIVDSGCEISVFGTDMIPYEYSTAKGRVKLVSAFGERLKADLVEIPVRMVGAPNEGAVALTCAVTGKLAKGTQALLNREDWAMIKAASASIQRRDPSEVTLGETQHSWRILQASKSARDSLPSLDVYPNDDLDHLQLPKAERRMKRKNTSDGSGPGKPEHKEEKIKFASCSSYKSKKKPKHSKDERVGGKSGNAYDRSKAEPGEATGKGSPTRKRKVKAELKAGTGKKDLAGRNDLQRQILPCCHHSLFRERKTEAPPRNRTRIRKRAKRTLQETDTGRRSREQGSVRWRLRRRVSHAVLVRRISQSCDNWREHLDNGNRSWCHKEPVTVTSNLGHRDKGCKGWQLRSSDGFARHWSGRKRNGPIRVERELILR